MNEEGALTASTGARLEEAFRLLANETRLEILFALYDAPDRVVSFSALNDRVGLGDSGRFNYHLKQLTDRFIYRTGEGYALLFSGIAVCRSMLAAIGADGHGVEPFALDSACYNCGESLEARYDHEHVVVRCPHCGLGFHDFPLPPGALAGRTTEELLRVYDLWTRAQTVLAANGLCTWCFGRMSSAIVTEESPGEWTTEGASGERENPVERRVRVVHRCDRCTGDMRTTVGESVEAYPAVVAFLHEHGVDAFETPSWELEFMWNDALVTVLAEDPWEVRLTIPGEDETLSVTIDGDVRVLDVRRERV
jgi:hypothetical protein